MDPKKPRPEGRKVETSIAIEAPPEAVWKALADADELKRWFPLDARIEPGAGGKIWISWGPPYEGTSEIEIWEPNRRLKTASRGVFGMAEVEGSARPVALDYVLEGKGGTTTLRLVHSGFGEGAAWEDEYDSVRRGWRYELKALRHYLERHRGRQRQVVWPRVPMDLTLMQAWGRLMSRDGLLADGRIEGLREGDRYAIRTAAGDDLRGTVLVNEAPDFAGTAENWNDALFRVHIEGSSGVREAGLWLAAYEVPQARLADLREAWMGLLRRIFPAPRR